MGKLTPLEKSLERNYLPRIESALKHSDSVRFRVGMQRSIDSVRRYFEDKGKYVSFESEVDADLRTIFYAVIRNRE